MTGRGRIVAIGVIVAAPTAVARLEFLLSETVPHEPCGKTAEALALCLRDPNLAGAC